MKRVYVAGPYSANNIIDCLENMRKGMRAGVEVFLAGYAPWVPWHDFHHQLMFRDGDFQDPLVFSIIYHYFKERRNK